MVRPTRKNGRPRRRHPRLRSQQLPELPDQKLRSPKRRSRSPSKKIRQRIQLARVARTLLSAKIKQCRKCKGGRVSMERRASSPGHRALANVREKFAPPEMEMLGSADVHGAPGVLARPPRSRQCPRKVRTARNGNVKERQCSWSAGRPRPATALSPSTGKALPTQRPKWPLQQRCPCPDSN